MRIITLWGCFLLCTLTFCVKAQSNYKPGILVKANGDTLKGYIDYREWEFTPTVIEFKTTLTDKNPVKLTAAQLFEFEITGIDKFLTYTGPLSASKNQYPELPFTLDTTTIKGTVFLRYRHIGSNASLLQQRDETKTRFFIAEAGKIPTELNYYQFFNADRTNVRTIEPYKDQLVKLVQKYYPENAKLIAHVENSKFNEPDLKDIIKFINPVKSNSLNQVNAGLQARFIMGLQLQHITSITEGGTFSGDQSTSYWPTISVGVDVLNNIHTQKFIIRTEFSVWSAKSSGTLVYRRYDYTRPSTYSFRQTTFSLNPRFIYNIYNKENLKFFVSAGIGLNYSLYSNTIDIGNNNSFKQQSVWLNYPFQAGVAFNRKIDVFATYAPSASYTSFVDFSAQNKIVGLGLHYYFTKTVSNYK
jgi:hypothetical protein